MEISNFFIGQEVMKLCRRDFLRASAVVAAKMILPDKPASAMGAFGIDNMFSKKLPKRILGKTGREVSIIAFGGIVVMNAEQKVADKVVADSVEAGVNYFDVAPSYGDAELKLAPALKPFRDKVFLACKTTCRDKAGAEKELALSLKRLQTDRLDLYQLHAIADVEKDVQAAFAKGGAMEAFLDARRKGIIKYIGFSAHSPAAAIAAMEKFNFDTIMYPVNFICQFNNDFSDEVIAKAKEQNMGIIAIKAIAKTAWQPGEDRTKYPKVWYKPIDEEDIAQQALSWTLAHGVSTTIPPCEESLYRLLLKLAPQCGKLSKEQLDALTQYAANYQPIFTG